jgi:hypothetical protein
MIHKGELARPAPAYKGSKAKSQTPPTGEAKKHKARGRKTDQQQEASKGRQPQHTT